MSFLIATAGKDKEEATLHELIKSAAFSDVFIVTDTYGKQNLRFPTVDGCDVNLLVLDFTKSSSALVAELTVGLKEIFSEHKILDLDMAVSIVSGNGKMHEVLLASVIKLGYGIRLIDWDKALIEL